MISKSWDNYRTCDIHKMGEPKGKERNRIFEAIMSENFPVLIIDIKSQNQESQNTKQKKKSKNSTYRHSKIKLQKPKNKEKIFKKLGLGRWGWALPIRN